jgi:drug/metabolite transporter (DMT)-like permease
MRKIDHLGVHLALFATMLCWGLNVSAVKLLTGQIDAVLVAATRTVIATATLALLMRPMRVPGLRWDGRTIGFGLVGGFLIIYLQVNLFTAGLSRTTATNGALIVALGPFISVLMERALFKRPIGWLQALGVGVALGGVTLVILSRPHAELSAGTTGDLLMFASIIAFSAGGAVVQRMSAFGSPLGISLLTHLAGGALLIGHTALGVDAPVAALLGMGWASWALMAFSGVLAGAVGAVVWGRGIAVLGVGRTATYLSWVPIFGVAFGALLLGEQLTLWHAVGVLAVLAGSWLSVSAAGVPRTLAPYTGR